MASPNASELATTTMINRQGPLRDNLTKNIALLNRLEKKGNIEPLDGGQKVYEAITYQENSNFQWYDGYDSLSVGATDLLTSAEFAWKQCAAALTISGKEEMINNGKSAVLQLVKGKVKATEQTLRNNMEVGLFSDGTGTGSKQIVGLDALVAATQSSGTYGAIDRALWTFWRAFTATATLSATNVEAKLDTMILLTTRGNDQMDLILGGTTAYGFLVQALQVKQRFQSANTDLAEAGFQTVSYMGADVVNAGGIGGAATATDFYGLNTNYVHYHPHSERNFVPLSERDAINQDATVKIIAWMGALTSSGPQFCGRHVGA